MSRHTEQMTDAYITGLRMRNSLRAAGAIQHLGRTWLLHPDNAITQQGYRKSRLPRTEVIDTRSVRDRVICTMAAFEGEWADKVKAMDEEQEEFEHQLLVKFPPCMESGQ